MPETFKIETPETIGISSTRRMGDLAGLQPCVFPHSHKSKIKKVSEFRFEQAAVPVYCSSIWPGYGSLGVHKGGQGCQTRGTIKGYLNPPVPR